MRIGYPCLNKTLGCSSSKTFRLASYSEEKLIETIHKNLDCLKKILQFNIANKIYFFRICSDLIPFASHSVNKFNWQDYFADDFLNIGNLINLAKMRVTTHPDQFIVINSPNPVIVNNSIKELIYHAEIFDLMKAGVENKIQIHVGGAYGDKNRSMKRFVMNYQKLPRKVQARLVIENDDRIYNVSDCLAINRETGVPVVVDVFHDQLNNNGVSIEKLLALAKETWTIVDGAMIIDFSTQQSGGRQGNHAKELDIKCFNKLIDILQRLGLNPDIMLEVKDKEASALKANNAIWGLTP